MQDSVDLVATEKEVRRQRSIAEWAWVACHVSVLSRPMTTYRRRVRARIARDH